MIRSIMLCFVLQALAFQSYALDTSKKIETLKMGVLTTPRLPYWGGSAQLPSGLVYDITSAMASDLHIDIKYVGFDTVEALHQGVSNGQVDFALRYKTEQGETTQNYLYSKPVYEDIIVSWVAPQIGEKLRWSCLRDSIFCKILSELDFDFVAVESTEQFYQKMFDGEVNSSIGLYRSFLYYFRNNNYDEEKITFDPRFGSVYATYMFQKSNVALKARVDSFIQSYRKNEDRKIKSVLSEKYGIYSSDFSKAQTKTLKYSLPDDSFPYSYYDSVQKRYRGVIHDIFKKVAAITPMRFEFVPSNDRSLEELLKNGIIDFIPIAKREQHDKQYFDYTQDFIDIDFALIENMTPSPNKKIGILDRFGFSNKNNIKDEFVLYKNSEDLFNDLVSGKLSNAYINRQLLESVYIDGLDFKYRILNDINELNLDIKSPMLIRKGDNATKNILDASFKLFTHIELTSLLNQYNKVDYKIGFQKNHVLYIIASILCFTAIVSISYTIYANKLKEKADGADKKSAISEAQRAWLVKIIDNIPNAVCIRDSDRSILLKNSQFIDLKSKFNFTHEMDFISFILNRKSIDSHSINSKDIYIEDKKEKKYYNISNSFVSHYIDNTILEMIVITDITAQKDKEDVLTQLHQEAQKSLNLKKNFLAVISHELRTPISGIVGIIELLENRIKEKTNRELLRNATASSSKLKLLVDDILDFSKIDARQLKITRYDSNIALELSPILRNFESLAEKKNLQFRVNWLPSNHVIYSVDMLRLIQIISNVLSNAIKFTDEGIVSIKIDAKKESICFVVKDSGIGMTEDEQQRIFDPFVQAQDNISRKYGGTGLGMSIVKNLVELMNGNIVINSSYGVGTTITISIKAISIPLGYNDNLGKRTIDNQLMANWLDVLAIPYTPHSILKPQSSLENFYPDSVIELLNNDSIADDHEVTTYGNLDGSILVVDDDPLNRYLVKMQLESLQMDSLLVNCGSEALELLQSGLNIRAVITDYHMPEINGLELASQIRSFSQFSDLPIIICTADHSEDVSSRAITRGINAIIHKPYSLEELAKHLIPFLAVQEQSENANCQATLTEWFNTFDKKNHAMMAEALISSLNLSLNDLNLDHKTKDVAHRLKGAAGSFGQSDIVDLCKHLELDPNNTSLKAKLVQRIEQVINEAKTIQANY